jgi:hypothetical protein
LLLPNYVNPSTRSPDFELFNRSGAKRIGGTQKNGVSFILVPPRKLADGSRLSRPVDTDHHDNRRRRCNPRHRTVIRLKNLEKALLDEIAQFLCVADQLAVSADADLIQNLRRGAHADIRRNERIFELIQQVGVNLLAAGDHVFDTVDESGACLLDTCLQAVE